MSLIKCPNCDERIGFWKVYKKINGKKMYQDHLLLCDKCNYKLGLKLHKKSFFEHMGIAGLWMAIPVLAIILVIIERLDAISAIVIVLGYHILAMLFIINFYNYKRVDK